MCYTILTYIDLPKKPAARKRIYAILDNNDNNKDDKDNKKKLSIIPRSSLPLKTLKKKYNPIFSHDFSSINKPLLASSVTSIIFKATPTSKKSKKEALSAPPHKKAKGARVISSIIFRSLAQLRQDRLINKNSLTK